MDHINQQKLEQYHANSDRGRRLDQLQLQQKQVKESIQGLQTKFDELKFRMRTRIKSIIDELDTSTELPDNLDNSSLTRKKSPIAIEGELK